MMSQVHIELDLINEHFGVKGYHFVKMEEDKTGFVNKTIFLEDKSGKEYVLRLISNMEDFKEAKTTNEVNTLKLVGKLGGIPASKVLDYDNSAENSLKFEYILMDRLPGKQLAKSIDTMTSEEVTSLMQQLLDALEPMWSLRFDKIGNLDENMVPQKMALMNGLGPFDHPTEMLPMSINFCLEAQQDMYVNHKDKIAKLMGILAEKFKDSKPAFITFCHWDLNFDNILVKDGKISGLVDWEWSMAATIEDEIFNCDFYRNEKFRNKFLEIVSKKLGFDAKKMMDDVFDFHAFGLGVLMFGWHKAWGLTRDSPMVVQWVDELKKLFEKHEIGEF